MPKKSLCVFSLLAGLSGFLWALPAWRQELPPALKAAQSKNSLVLVDFYAPWCYSCYYMDQNVLSQPELSALQGQLEFVKMDVDSPQGTRLKKDWQVHFLPTYVVLDAKGQEVGRIVGEQVRGDFFSQLKRISDQHSTLDALQKKLTTAGSAEARSILLEILGTYVQRQDYKQGLEFWNRLPKKRRAAEQADPDIRKQVLRLELERFRDKKSAADCLRIGRALMALDLGCNLPYDAEHLNSCIETLPAGRRLPAYSAEEAPLKRLLTARVFGRADRRCADILSPIELAHDVYTATDRKAKASELMDKAIRLLQSEIGDDFKKDRNKSDNLRVFLEMDGRFEPLRSLYPMLIAAYPDEYVYYHRFGKFLMKQGSPTDALAQFDLALPKAYGANRLAVIGERAKALAQIGRRKEALDELSGAIGDNPATFPDAVASLTRIKTDIDKPSN